MVEAAGCGDRLRQHLADGVVIRRQIKPERIDTGLLCARLITRQEVAHAGKIHGFLRRPEGVIDHAVEQGAQRFHQGRKLQTDHSAAEQLHALAHTYFIESANNCGGIRRVGGHKHRFRTLGAQGAHDRRKIDGIGRVILVVDQFQRALFQFGARAFGQALCKLGVGGKDGDFLRAESGRDIEVRYRPFPPGSHRHVVEKFVVAHGRVDIERKITDQQQIAPLDERHDRRGDIGAIRADQQIDLVDIQQFCVDARRGGRIGLVVVGHQFHRPPEQSTGGVHIVAPHLQGEQAGFSRATERTGLRDGKADANRFFTLCLRRNECEQQPKSRAEHHRMTDRADSSHHSLPGFESGDCLWRAPCRIVVRCARLPQMRAMAECGKNAY